MALHAAMVRRFSMPITLSHAIGPESALMSIKPTASFMKAAGLLAFLSLTPLSIYIMYNRTGGPESQKEMGFQKNLRYALMGESLAIDLAPLTEWPWVTACAIDSGTTREEMTAIIGFDYKDYDQLHWLPLKTHWTLMFIDFEREASWGMARPVVPVRIPRAGLADVKFPEGVKGVCVLRETGRLLFQRRNAAVGVSPIVTYLRELSAPLAN
ncbi:MAG: hypothetical protein EXR11_06090 [Rhodospirillaceae bacterium]|nr:hypothetical protein [Rhodospirillaceae bacterium]